MWHKVAGHAGADGYHTAFAPSSDVARRPPAKLPNCSMDDPSPDVAEGEHIGAKTVSQWREEFLGDFATRMDRCKSPVSP